MLKECSFCSAPSPTRATKASWVCYPAWSFEITIAIVLSLWCWMCDKQQESFSWLLWINISCSSMITLCLQKHIHLISQNHIIVMTLCKTECTQTNIFLLHIFKWGQVFSALVTDVINISQVSVSKQRRYANDIHNVCWKNLIKFQNCVMEHFSHLSLFYRWNISKILKCSQAFTLPNFGV